MSVQTALALDTSPWMQVRDGDPRLRDFYNRHYSSRGGDSPLIVGPGFKLVLLTPAIDALLAWRLFADACELAPGNAANCAVFRREPSAPLASELIVAAEPFAYRVWGASRFYTYVDPARVASRNPGYCFLRAGYRRVGMTKGGHGRPPLVVLEKVPA